MHCFVIASNWQYFRCRLFPALALITARPRRTHVIGLGVCRASAWRAQTAIHMKETPSSPIFAQFVGTLKRRQGGGSSLYQDVVGSNGVISSNEVAENVSDLEIEYLTASGGALADATYVNASGVSNWGSVLAVRLSITVRSPDSVGTDGQPLTRTMTSVVSIRNRNP